MADDIAAGTCIQCGKPTQTRRCASCGTAFLVNGYRVERVVAQSPQGRTYLARDAGGAGVLLKELVFALAPDTRAIEAFQREADLLRQLQHPRIPRFVASFADGEGAETRLYLVEAYLEGVSLEAELANHRYSEDEVRKVGSEVLQILEFLHALSPPVLHRDIKPANLMRAADGQISLVDFGVAQDAVATGRRGATVVGTFGYAAPEQLAGVARPQSDLYSVGVTLVQLLTRQAPWELLPDGLDLDLSGLTCSPVLKWWLKRMVAHRHDQRFQSAAEARAALALQRVPLGLPEVPAWAPRLARQTLGAAGLLGACWLGWGRLAPHLVSSHAPQVSLLTRNANGRGLMDITSDGKELFYSGFPTVELWGVSTPLYRRGVGESYTGVPGAFVQRLSLQGGAPDKMMVNDAHFGPMGLAAGSGALYMTDPNGGGGENVVTAVDPRTLATRWIYDANNTPRNGSGLAFDDETRQLFVLDSFGGTAYQLDAEGRGFQAVTPEHFHEVGEDYGPQHHLALAVGRGALYMGDSGQAGVSQAGVYTHLMQGPSLPWTPIQVGPLLRDVEGITYDPDDDLLYFTESGTNIYATARGGGPLLGPITHPAVGDEPGFVALRGITYVKGSLYVVDGQNLDNHTARPGVIWKVALH